MGEELVTLRGAAEILNVKPWVVTHLLTAGKAPEPQRVGGRRMFSRRDIARIRAALVAAGRMPQRGGDDAGA